MCGEVTKVRYQGTTRQRGARERGGRELRMARRGRDAMESVFGLPHVPTSLLPSFAPLTCASAPQTCLLSLASCDTTRGARYATAPASTTAWASSGVCLATSDSAEAAMRLRDSSGSWTHSTRSGTAPASTTCCARSAV